MTPAKHLLTKINVGSTMSENKSKDHKRNFTMQKGVTTQKQFTATFAGEIGDLAEPSVRSPLKDVPQSSSNIRVHILHPINELEKLHRLWGKSSPYLFLRPLNSLLNSRFMT